MLGEELMEREGNKKEKEPWLCITFHVFCGGSILSCLPLKTQMLLRSLSQSEVLSLFFLISSWRPNQNLNFWNMLFLNESKKIQLKLACWIIGVCNLEQEKQSHMIYKQMGIAVVTISFYLQNHLTGQIWSTGCDLWPLLQSHGIEKLLHWTLVLYPRYNSGSSAFAVAWWLFHWSSTGIEKLYLICHFQLVANAYGAMFRRILRLHLG